MDNLDPLLCHGNRLSLAPAALTQDPLQSDYRLRLFAEALLQRRGPLSQHERERVIAEARQIVGAVVERGPDRTRVTVDGLVTTLYPCGHVTWDCDDVACAECASDRSRVHAARLVSRLHASDDTAGLAGNSTEFAPENARNSVEFISEQFHAASARETW